MAGFQTVNVSTREADVAEAVWRAAHDTTGQLGFRPVGTRSALTQVR